MNKNTFITIAACIMILFAGLAFYLTSLGNSASKADISGAIQPLAYSIDSEELMDGYYYVSFKAEEVKQEDGGCLFDFTIYDPNLYEPVDVCMLTPGQYIMANGSAVKIKTISGDDPIKVNGGADKGGLDFIVTKDGYYQLRQTKTGTGCKSLGKLQILIPEYVSFYDLANTVDNEGGAFVPGDRMYEYFSTVRVGEYIPENTTIRLSDGQVVEFERVRFY